MLIFVSLKNVTFLNIFKSFLWIYLLTTCYGLCERTKDRMYESVPAARACIRRLNGTHQVGCGSERGGSHGVIHLCRTQYDLDMLLTNGTAPPYVPLIAARLYTAANVAALEQSKSPIVGTPMIAGLVVFGGDRSRPAHFTHATQCPNEAANYPNTCPTEGEGRQWNPYGTGLLLRNVPFPIFWLDTEQYVSFAIDCFHKFNNYSFETQPSRPLCALELDSFMYATIDTPTCLRRSDNVANMNPFKFCDPLGDRNIWAALFPLVDPMNVTHPLSYKKYIVLAARLDAVTMFDENSVEGGAASGAGGSGAQASITAIVTLLATAKLLKQMLPTVERHHNVNVLFVLFNGESFDYIGSQRFVYDMKRGAFPGRGPKNRYTLPPIHLKDIALYVELSQLANRGRLVLHYLQQQKGANSNSTLFNAFLRTLMEHSGNISIQQNPSEQHLPPASLHTFLRHEGITFPGIILADHTDSYSNNYFSSIYDNVTNLDYRKGDYPRPEGVQRWTANVSEALAAAIYSVIQKKDNNTLQSKTADVVLIDELYYCYLVDANCLVHKALQYSNLPKKPFNLYVSVMVVPNLVTNLIGGTLAWLVGDVLEATGVTCGAHSKVNPFKYYNMSKSLSDLKEVSCYRAQMNYTEAVSPAFLIEDYNWTSGEYSTWAESAWGNGPRMRVYLKPSRGHEILTFSVGCTVFLLSLLVTYIVGQRAHLLFAASENSSLHGTGGALAMAVGPVSC